MGVRVFWCVTGTGDGARTAMQGEASVDTLSGQSQAASESTLGMPGKGRRFLVIDDSQVFLALASSTVALTFLGAEVVRHNTFDTAAHDLKTGSFDAIICGYGIGEGKTAHDLRLLTDAPMVVLTGRLGGVDAPRGAVVVEKGAGPEALSQALHKVLA